MFTLSRLALGVAPLALIAGAAEAQLQPAGNSLPQPVTITDTIPAPRDVAYPGGTIRLAVDATELTRRRSAVEARGANAWRPAAPRARRISTALRAYAAFTTSASKGAVRVVPDGQSMSD